MKGLTHFISAIATVSFIPAVVQRAAAPRPGYEGAESSFLLALAGLYGIMPDTLDFKVGRFFERADIEIFPDDETLDAQAIAEKIGKAMDRAYEENQEIRVQFNTIKLGADRWRRYSIDYDTDNHELVIEFKEIVTTSQVPFPGTAPTHHRAKGRYALQKARLIPGGARETKVDIMSGPMYGYRREGDNLAVDFLPWHRTWSHSYVVGAMLALPLFAIAWLLGWSNPWLFPVVGFLGFATHITEDLTGHMGGSLLWPIFKKRCKGLALFHASNPDANFVTDYIAIILIIFNLNRFSPGFINLHPVLYFTIFLIAPLMLYFLPRTLGHTRRIAPEDLETNVERIISSRRKGIDELTDEAESIVN